MVVPDGMPLVWACKSAGYRRTERVYGPDLMLEVCDLSQQTGWSHYFYGGAEGVAQQLASNLQSKFPAMNAVGAFTPPFRPLSTEETRSLEADVKERKPDILWVGLGTPKQELFMHEMQQRLNVPVMVGVGAAFDFHTGRVRQAPRFLRRAGMEWAFRLAMEPRRLFKRYARNNPAFLVGIARNRPSIIDRPSVDPQSTGGDQ